MKLVIIIFVALVSVSAFFSNKLIELAPFLNAFRHIKLQVFEGDVQDRGLASTRAPVKEKYFYELAPRGGGSILLVFTDFELPSQRHVTVQGELISLTEAVGGANHLPFTKPGTGSTDYFPVLVEKKRLKEVD